MKEKDIQNLLIEVITKNQQINGIEDCFIDINTRPIDELNRFDSLTALEVIIDLEQILKDRFNLNIDIDISVFFTDMSRKKIGKVLSHSSQSIEEIAENIFNYTLNEVK